MEGTKKVQESEDTIASTSDVNVTSEQLTGPIGDPVEFARRFISDSNNRSLESAEQMLADANNEVKRGTELKNKAEAYVKVIEERIQDFTNKGYGTGSMSAGQLLTTSTNAMSIDDPTGDNPIRFASKFISESNANELERAKRALESERLSEESAKARAQNIAKYVDTVRNRVGSERIQIGPGGDALH